MVVGEVEGERLAEEAQGEVAAWILEELVEQEEPQVAAEHFLLERIWEFQVPEIQALAVAALQSATVLLQCPVFLLAPVHRCLSAWFSV